MNNIEYILATEADVPTLVNCRIDFLLDYWGPQADETIIELKQNLEKYFHRALRNKTYICWVAKIDGEIAGAGGLLIRDQAGNFKNPGGKMGYVFNMYTVPAHRRKGIATNILNRLTATGNELGIKVFELHATKEGEPVYVKNGFLLHPEPTYRKFYR
jgi:GNAT superfamily N-acetyltransferase